MSVRETLFSPLFRTIRLRCRFWHLLCVGGDIIASGKPRHVGCSDSCNSILIVLYFLYPELHSIEHSYHRSDDHHCVACDCG